MKDLKAESFEQHRQVLEGLAYRMLGSLAEAQDVVHETYLKWHGVELSSIDNPRAWLITVCSRLAMNQLNSARKRREVYVGEWLPEPFVEDVAGPSALHEINDTLSMALLLTLEKLTPVERAAFLLHDVFELGFDEVAEVLGKTPANCRQLAARARQRVRSGRPRFPANGDQHRQLLEGFVAASTGYAFDQLIVLLATEVELYSDGGGKVEALPAVMRGAGAVAAFFVDIFSHYARQGARVEMTPQRFNGALGVLVSIDGELTTALTIEADATSIHKIYAVRNPSKLGGIIRLRTELRTA